MLSDLAKAGWTRETWEELGSGVLQLVPEDDSESDSEEEGEDYSDDEDAEES